MVVSRFAEKENVTQIFHRGYRCTEISRIRHEEHIFQLKMLHNEAFSFITFEPSLSRRSRILGSIEW